MRRTTPITLLLAATSFLGCGPPRDDVYVDALFDQREQFEELRDRFDRSGLAGLGQSHHYPQDHPIAREDVEALQALLRETNALSMGRSNWDPNCPVWITMFAPGFAGDRFGKGYAICEQPPQRIVRSHDGGGLTPDGPLFRHVVDDWYIYWLDD